MEAFKYQVITSTPTLAVAVRVSADGEHLAGRQLSRTDLDVRPQLRDGDEDDAIFYTSFLWDELPGDIAEALSSGGGARGEEVVIGEAQPGVTTSEELLYAALRVPAGSVTTWLGTVPDGASLWDEFGSQARFPDAEFVEASLWEWAADAPVSASPDAPVRPRGQRWQPSRKGRK